MALGETMVVAWTPHPEWTVKRGGVCGPRGPTRAPSPVDADFPSYILMYITSGAHGLKKLQSNGKERPSSQTPPKRGRKW